TQPAVPGLPPEEFRLIEEVADERERLGHGDGLVFSRGSDHMAEPGRGRRGSHSQEDPVGQTLEHHQLEGAENSFEKRVGHVRASAPQAMAISRASVVKASSTPSPVLALVFTTLPPRSTSATRVASCTCHSRFRSFLFNSSGNGTRPITDSARFCRLTAVSSVECRVPSATSRYPVAPRR